MAEAVKIAELKEQYGDDWFKHYTPTVRGRFRVFCLYLGLFALIVIAAVEVLVLAAAPILFYHQGARIARVERELVAERRLVDRLAPPRPSIEATR